jgi:hypothetical protein
MLVLAGRWFKQKCDDRKEQALRQDARDQTGKITRSKPNARCGQQSGNRKIVKIFFVSMAYCLWCARRAHAFVAISMGYRDPLQHKVHFGRKSSFEEMPL